MIIRAMVIQASAIRAIKQLVRQLADGGNHA